MIAVAVGQRLAGVIALGDDIRPDAVQAVTAMREAGIRPVLATGDNGRAAAHVVAEVGIEDIRAGILPEEKAALVRELQDGGNRVAMVGDGVNDAPALTRADVGIAIGAGTDVAMESAGVVLASDDPRAVLSMIELSQASYRKMIQNLIWASGYNILAVPLAAGMLASIGFVLSPAVGAILMSASTIVVALNAQLLRRIDLDPAHLAPTDGKEEKAAVSSAAPVR